MKKMIKEGYTISKKVNIEKYNNEIRKKLTYIL